MKKVIEFILKALLALIAVLYGLFQIAVGIAIPVLIVYCLYRLALSL